MTRPPHSADEILNYIEIVTLGLGFETVRAIKFNIRYALDVEYGRGAESVVERVKDEPRKTFNYRCERCGHHGHVKLRRIQ